MSAKASLIGTVRQLRHRMQLPAAARRAIRHDRGTTPATDPGIERSVGAALAWLCRAQDQSATSDGGVARHFSLIDGWGPSYPETTGYIIPTFLDYARDNDDADVSARARHMLDWLLAIQLDGGGFQGGTITDRPVVPVVFNTGQILMGLSAGAKEFGAPYVEAMHEAAGWLVDIQHADGSWQKHQSPFARPGDKAYDTHTAWGLLEAARASGETRYGDAALGNIRWALTKQQENGWLADCCLTDPLQPLTHTLGYTLKGVIEGYAYSGDETLLAAARRTADGLLQTVGPTGFIPGRLDRNWTGAVSWACLTGSVQIAQCWLQLFETTGDSRYLDAARTVNRYVRCTVSLDDSPDTRGGIRGSFPVDGEYGQYQYLNWAAKFFIDANLLERSILERRS